MITKVIPVDTFSGSTEPFLMAETFLKKAIIAYETALMEITNHIYFDDIDAITDCIYDHSHTLYNLRKDIEHCKANPIDIFFDWKPKNGKVKFRRYANNKRTNQEFRNDKIRKIYEL